MDRRQKNQMAFNFIEEFSIVKHDYEIEKIFSSSGFHH